MLRSLHIENYAIIRSVKINFDEGFTVITGETGSGKSIIIGALSLILGKRADTSILHDKTRKCFVEGEFDIQNLNLQDFFADNDLDYAEITIIRREVNENGKSRAFINDTPVTLSVLKTLAESLVDIHSQHHNLLINNENFRINLIDQYAQVHDLLIQYQNCFSTYKKCEKQLSELKETQRQQEQERDYLKYVFKELEEAQLSEGEQDTIEQQIQLLSNAESIKSKLYNSLQLLAEDEEQNLLHQLQSIREQCQSVCGFDAELAELTHRIDSSLLELKDIANDLRRKENAIEVNPQELERLNERLDQLIKLEHKHRVENNEQLIKLRDSIDQKLSSIDTEDARISQLEKDCEKLRMQTLELAKKLSDKRRQASTKFEQEMTDKLQLLGMKDGQFQLNFISLEAPNNTGMDKIDFLFSANKGSEMDLIEKNASGGEMSRLMLAMKSIINDNALLPTVVFDEIDTGISGEVAGKVAQLMQQFSHHHQLIVITHLPQIAAYGKKHYFVYKDASGDKTYTQIKSLNNEESIREIATMIGGEHLSDAVIKTAKELKNNILL